jgi:hypothetical protein
MRKLSDLLKPRKSHGGIDAKVFHKESIDVIITKSNGKKKKI